MAGRPSRLEDPEFVRALAEAFVSGMTRQQIADEFGVRTLETISRWRRDPRVKAICRTLMEDRILQITRRVDSSIEARLAHADKLSVKELLDIRREFLGGALREKTERIDEEVIGEAADALEDNPQLVDQINELLSSRG